ncbi:YetF domain-containing protein [Lysinibacillus fusiformis]
MNVFYLTIEIVIGFFLLFILVKIVGKKIINQVSPFTFIAAIVLGELLGNALYDEKVGVLYIIYSMVLWALLLLIVEILGQKFLKLRLIFEGKPSVLIRDGVINREQLKKNRMNINQLQSLLRQSETFSIREVAYCYLESNGSISILKKSPYQKTTREDFNKPLKQVHVPVTIIRDGKLLVNELRDIGKNEEWLKVQLKTQNIMDIRDVFIAEWLENDGLFVQTFS